VTLNPWLGIALVLALLLGLFGALRLVQRFAAPHPEIVRKLMHVGMGLATLSFPWLFKDVWPVLLLVGLSMVALATVRCVSALKSGFGSVLGGVARKSLGEFYFILSVACLFWLARGETFRLILYGVPLLILTLADAAAALIGLRYGQRHYETLDGQKSAEGSTAFFFTTFFSAHVPLLLATDIGRAQTLLIALALGLYVMMCEAIAWHGLDNLLVPLASYLLLKTYIGPPGMETWGLVLRVCVLCSLLVFVWIWRRQTTLAGSALFGAAIVGYLCWALGGWEWLLPPLTVFVTYALLAPRDGRNRLASHNVDAVIATAAAGLIWLFLYRVLARRDFYYPFVLSFTAQLAILGLVRTKGAYPGMRSVPLVATSVVKGCLLVFVPFVVIDWQSGITGSLGRTVVMGIVAVGLAVVFFFGTQPALDNCPSDAPRWFRQAISSGLASVVGLASLHAPFAWG
jgi:phytol kinase